jgi:hypothetical protein
MSTETWSARIDWADECTDEQLAAIADALAGHHGALTTNAASGRVSAQLTVHATTLRQAIDNSLTAVRDAVHAAHGRFNPVRVDVVDEATFQAELVEPAIPPLVGYAEIAEMAGVSRQRARELPNLPDFPPAVTETSSKGPLRVRSQVATWIQGWERRAGRPPTPPSNRPTSNTLLNYPGQMTPGLIPDPGMEYLPAEIDELTRDQFSRERAAGQYRDEDGH